MQILKSGVSKTSNWLAIKSFRFDRSVFDMYELEDVILDRLEFSCLTKVGKKGNTKDVKDEDGNVVLL